MSRIAVEEAKLRHLLSILDEEVEGGREDTYSGYKCFFKKKSESDREGHTVFDKPNWMFRIQTESEVDLISFSRYTPAKAEVKQASNTATRPIMALVLSSLDSKEALCTRITPTESKPIESQRVDEMCRWRKKTERRAVVTIFI